ncbi:MAG: TonB-dependent receptor [Rhodospirillaceae bacterium]|nr:TonB-dependent receptor [Rhodospirillaceae bacterium]
MKISQFFLGTTGALGVALLFSSGQVAAQGQSASASAMLEEVIVTARRREESLTDLPLSVAAITADTMQAQGIYDIMDVSNFVPNVNFTHTNRRAVTALYIRGIGNNSPVPLRSTGAGVYIDGHYLPNTVGQMLNTVDVERIEVMRGPQGTLFGKNTTGGAINVISAKPGGDFESSLLLRAGDHGQQDFRGMLNLPINDTVAARFSVAKETSDGWHTNRFFGETYGATDLNAFSTSFRITPNDNWMIDLGFRGNYQDDDNAPGRCNVYPNQAVVNNLANRNPGGGMNLPANDPRVLALHPPQIYTGPTYENGRGQWGGSTNFGMGVRANIGGHIERLYPGATLDMWAECEADAAAGDFVFSSEKRTFLKLDNENINVTVQWDSAGEVGAFDNLNFKTIASTHQTDYAYFQDRDFSPFPVNALGTPPIPGGARDRKTDSLELLLTADASDRVSFILGTHFYKDFVHNGKNCLELARANFAQLSDPNSGFSIECMPDGGTGFDWMPYPRAVPGGPESSGRAGNVSAESEAVFGHATFQLNDNWTLDAGVRYTSEDRGFNQTEFAAAAGTCKFGGPGDPDPSTICEPDYILTYGSMFLDGFYNDQAANFTATTPMLSLTRDFEESMIYFTYSEGFLSGAFNDELNVNLVPELAPLLTYGPEYVANYEAGFKGTFADGRVRLAGAIFKMDYTDKHEGIGIDNSEGQFGNESNISIITNAASVDISGIEFELRAAPWDGGFVSLDFGVLDSKYGEFTSFDPDNPNAVGGIVDQSNLSIADFSPDYTVNASIEHQFQLGNGATLTPLLGVYAQDDYDFRGNLDTSVNERSYCFQPAYSTMRARVTYRSAEDNWQASLFGSNIADERYFDWCGNGRGGVMMSRFGRPDTWGLEFRYDWGN